jgi:hypothetical protein
MGKINFSGGMILELNEIALVLSVFIRVHLCSSCQNPHKQRVSWNDGRPLSAKVSVTGRMVKQFAKTG